MYTLDCLGRRQATKNIINIRNETGHQKYCTGSRYNFKASLQFALRVNKNVLHYIKNELLLHGSEIGYKLKHKI